MWRIIWVPCMRPSAHHGRAVQPARHGCGDHVDVSLQDVLVADPFLRIITRYSVTGEVPERTGHSQSTTVAETYQCQDGYARIFVNQPDHWRRFVEWLGNPPELARSETRERSEPLHLRPMIDRLVEARTLNYTVKEFFEEFQSRSVGGGADQFAERSTFGRANTASRLCRRSRPSLVGHSIEFPGDPYKFSESPWRIGAARRCSAQHQDEVSRRILTSRQSGATACAWLPTANAAMRKPFEGIRVISFPTGIVGPALAGLLADQGAEVITIEAGRVVAQPAARPTLAGRLGSRKQPRP